MSNLARNQDVLGAEPETQRLSSLEERLQRMNWPEPPAGVRERTLEKLRRQLAEVDASAGTRPAD